MRIVTMPGTAPGRLSTLLLVLLLSACGTLHAPAGEAEDAALAHLLAPPAWPAEATQDAPRLDVDALRDALRAEIDAARRAHGLPALEWDGRLERIASAHSADMAENDYFGHVNLRGETPTDRAQAGVGENLYATHRYAEYAVETTPDGTRWAFEWKDERQIAREAVEGWLASRTHRANLLSPLYRAGAVGVALDDNEALFITQNLAAR